MLNQDSVIPEKEFFSTGEAATYCAVTPNAVFKWIQEGKIPADRTPGGHYRISRESLISLLKARQALEKQSYPKKLFQYCWEFHSRYGKIAENCRKCIVYKSRTGRCYELVKFANDIGHSKLFCANSCEECDYYDMVHTERISLLVVTDREDIRRLFRLHIEGFDCSLRFVENEYQCSMLVESYKPDYIFFDCIYANNGNCAVGCNSDFIDSLSADLRIPFARIIIIGEADVCSQKCGDKVFSFIAEPSSSEDIIELIEEKVS
jgi:excisionase family DNA binding protein